MRYCALVLAVVVIGYLATSTLRKASVQPASPPTEEVITVLKPVPAILNEDTLAPVVATETKINRNDDGAFKFKRAQFVNENHGWVMSDYSLYRTVDGGKNWERLSQEPEKDARFVSFSFVDESHGWLAILKQDFAEHYGVGSSSVIMVTDDGGKSWKLQASFPDEIKLQDIEFFNSTQGLAVGARGLDKRPDRAELFVLGTSNGGKNWNDISGPAKAAFKNQWGVANDSGKFIYTTPSSLLLLTEGGRVMSTSDNGKTWNTIVIFQDERPGGFISSTSYHKVLLDAEQRFRVVAAAMGDEGYWGDFIVNDEGRWTSYELKLTPILDAVFMSDKDVVACGLNLRPRNERANHRLDDAGIVLRSFDNGRSWQTIYRSKSHETFFFLDRVKDNDFYAVSDMGTFLRFSLPQ
jgi:photosystem II stability/assembly factor-like uncharacterized protein